MDGDGYGEVYVATYIAEADGFAFTRIYGFDYKGRELTDAGFPKIVLGSPAKCVPLIAEIDGDGQKELICRPGGEPIMAWESDGSVTPGFPMLGLPGFGEVSPAVADLDQDGDVELMVIADYRFHVLDLPAAVRPRTDRLGHGGARSAELQVAFRGTEAGPGIGADRNSPRPAVPSAVHRLEPGQPDAALVRRQSARRGVL